jgi:hypothetical protein
MRAFVVPWQVATAPTTAMPTPSNTPTTTPAAISASGEDAAAPANNSTVPPVPVANARAAKPRTLTSVWRSRALTAAMPSTTTLVANDTAMGSMGISAPAAQKTAGPNTTTSSHDQKNDDTSNAAGEMFPTNRFSSCSTSPPLAAVPLSSRS